MTTHAVIAHPFLYIFYYLENNLVDMNTSSDDEEASPDLAGLSDHHGICPVKLPCALPLNFVSIFIYFGINISFA